MCHILNSCKILSFLNSEESHGSASSGMHGKTRGCCFPLKHPALLTDITKRGEYSSTERRTLIYMYPTCCVSTLINVRLFVEMVSFIFTPENWRLLLPSTEDRNLTGGFEYKQKKETVNWVCRGRSISESSRFYSFCWEFKGNRDNVMVKHKQTF